MTFRDEDLHAEIEEMFAALQPARDEVSTGDAAFPLGQAGRGHGGGPGGKNNVFNRGYRVFTPNPVKTPERKAAMCRYERGYAADRIRERLLAGERPKVGGRGRPPTRWLKIAAELGIDLPRAEKPAITAKTELPRAGL
jgi:hypothetical protein